MTVHFHSEFKKQYKKLSHKEREKTDTRLMLFKKDPHIPILNNHALQGKDKKFRSINITGDLRALYEEINKNTAFFIILNTHSNLYD